MFESKRGTSKVVDNLPIATRFFIKKTPDRLLVVGLNAWLNRIFKSAIERGELNFLYKKNARLVVADVALNFAITLVGRQLKVTFSPITEDVCITAKLIDYLLLITGKADPDTLFFRRRLMISGDTELGLLLKNFLDTLEPEQLLPPQLYPLMDKLAEMGRAREKI